MNYKCFLFGLMISLLGLSSSTCIGQIWVDKDTFFINEAVTFSIPFSPSIKLEQLNYPKIDGLQASGNTILNKRKGKVIQLFYYPEKKGHLIIKPFSIGGNQFELDTIFIKDQKDSIPSLLSESKQGNQTNLPEPILINYKDDAFLSLSILSDSVSLGEGIHAILAFYVSDSNEAELEFFNLSSQLIDIKEKLLPENCWFEEYDINDYTPRPILLNDKNYNQYTLLRGTYIPLRGEKVVFSSTKLDLYKYFDLINPEDTSTVRKSFIITYPSREVIVPIKPANKENLPFGEFDLSTIFISDTVALTNSPITISGWLQAKGFIGNVNWHYDSSIINYYDNQVMKESIFHAQSELFGRLHFKITFTINKPNTYQLKELLQLPYFNAKMGRYDSLAINQTIRVINKKEREQLFSTLEEEWPYKALLDDKLSLKQQVVAYWFKHFIWIVPLLLIIAVSIILIKLRS